MATTRRSSAFVLAAVLALPIFVACGGSHDTGAPQQQAAPAAPRDPSVIEESDLYKLVGTRLYVHNRYSGLNVVDVSDPRLPRLLGRAAAEGNAGELYVRDQHALVLLEHASSACGRFDGAATSVYSWASEMSELWIVDARDAARPSTRARLCLPGSVVSSRLVGRTLYVVTSDVTADAYSAHAGGATHVLVIDVSDVTRVRMLEHRVLPDAGREIHVTDRALFVAARSAESSQRTVVHYYAIDGERGTLEHRGQHEIDGEPQGRFHIDARGDMLRIVTYDGASILSVLRFGADGLSLLGSLRGIAPGERLYATRFDGDRAYVVTFRQTDPLWIIDLSNAASPRIIGTLAVPGWSDYIFPRGDRLLAVGRGPNGVGFGVSLFDISDLEHPRTLSQLSFSAGDNTASTANTDHRAVTIVDRPEQLPLLIVPFSDYSWSSDGMCQGLHHLQLIDVGSWSLTRRGRVDQRGAVERTLLLGQSLLSLSDRDLQSLDISDRDSVRRQSVLDLDNEMAPSYSPTETCWPGANDLAADEWYRGCSVPRGTPAAPPLTLLLLVFGLVIGRARRRRRQSAEQVTRTERGEAIGIAG